MSKRSTLVKKLDKVFSQFIRQRDANSKGICTCATCSKQLPIKEIHCGHFMSRRSMATRWHPLNCASQCPSCNTFNQGRQFKIESDKGYWFPAFIDQSFNQDTTYTEFTNEHHFLTKSEANKMILFAGEEQHRSVGQSDTNLRVNININFI